MVSDSDIPPRGWKASEKAERDAATMMMMIQNDPPMPIALSSSWYWDANIYGKSMLTLVLALLSAFILYMIRSASSRLRRSSSVHRLLYRNIEDKVDSNCDSFGVQKHPIIVEEDDTGGSKGACSCSNITQQHMVPAKKGLVLGHDGWSDDTDDSEVMSKRVDEAAEMINHIHSKIPDTASSAEKVTMAHLYLEAMKVNESCKASSSMQRMEGISKQGNHIQKKMYNMRKEEYLEEQMSKRAREFSKMAMDIMCTGIVVMLVSGSLATWYSGSIWYRIEVCSEQSLAMYKASSVWSMLSSMVALSHVITCHITHAAQALQAVVILTLTPVVISKFGTFDSQSYSSMPVFRIGTTFGIICGISGTYAVHWLGGHAIRWLLLWEVWVGIFIMACTSSKRICNCGSIPTTLMWLCLGMIYPIIMGRSIMY